jgi:hypothetical protein
VRDGIALARSGLPAVAFVTAEFWPQGDFVAKAEGMPELPRVNLPHPVAGIGRAAMAELADEICAQVMERLTQG